MSKEERFDRARHEFAKAARELEKVWSELGGEYGSPGYPFEKSFDEVLISILSWTLTDPKS